MDEEKSKEVELDDKEKPKKGKKGKKIAIISVVVFMLIAAASVGSYFYFKPSVKPMNVVAKNIALHKVEISWDKIDKIENYEVVFSTNEFNGDDVHNALKNNSLDQAYRREKLQNKTSIQFENLAIDTDYYFVVLGYSENNDKINYTNPSDVVKIHTLNFQTSKVTDLVANTVTDKSISLQWTPFATEEKNIDGTDVDVSYSIFTINKENGEDVELAKDIKENSYLISDLTPLSSYSYKIIAQIKIDEKIISGEESDTLVVVTKPMAVSGINAKANGTSAIVVSWNNYDVTNLKNDDGSDVTVTYNLFVCDSKDGEYQLAQSDYTQVSYTEQNLQEAQTKYYYVVTKVALNGNNYESDKSEIVSATTDKKVVVQTPTTNTTKKPTNSNNSQGSNTSQNQNNNSNTGTKELSKSEKNAQARVIARQIAASAKNAGSTDLEKVTAAARMVSSYYYKGVHKESGPDYNTPYGVFIKGEASCAGCTRALGMVLEEMGYSWQHANENQWTHQWCIVTMDGQKGWADGQVGFAGYGSYL